MSKSPVRHSEAIMINRVGILVAILFAGCSSGSNRIQAKTADGLIKEIDRLEKRLPDEQRAEFKMASQRLSLLVMTEAHFDETAASAALLQRFNGKTAADIVKESEAIPIGAFIEAAEQLKPGK